MEGITQQSRKRMTGDDIYCGLVKSVSVTAIWVSQSTQGRYTNPPSDTTKQGSRYAGKDFVVHKPGEVLIFHCATDAARHFNLSPDSVKGVVAGRSAKLLGIWNIELRQRSESEEKEWQQELTRRNSR